MSSVRRLSCLALSSTALFLAAACSAGNTSHSADPTGMPEVPQPSPSVFAKETSDSLPTFPIEQYLTKVSENGQLTVAARSLIRTCMSGFGLDYKGPEVPRATLRSQDSGINKARRYGVIDLGVAETLGYHPSDGPVKEGPGQSPKPRMSDSENRVFIGDGDPLSGVKPGDKYAGKEIPRGGCSGQAAEKLGTKKLGHTAQQINNTSFGRSMENTAVKKVFQEWSTCMSAEGYKFDTPMQALGQSIAPNPTASEIAMAKTDVKCKRKVNLVGVWFTVESEIQKGLIGKQEETLVEEKKSLADALRAAANTGKNGQ